MDLAASSMSASAALSFRDALILAGVSLALVLFGRVLLAIPRRLMRGFGVVGLGAALILFAFGLATLALGGMNGVPEWLFASGWLLGGAGVWILAARIARAFPTRAPRLHAVGAPEGDREIGERESRKRRERRVR